METRGRPSGARGWRSPQAVATFLGLVLVGTLLVGDLPVRSGPQPQAPGNGHFSPFAIAISAHTGTTCTSKSTVQTGSLGTVASGASVYAFVEINQGASQTVTGVTDTAGDTFVKDGAATNSGNTRAEIWHKSFTAGSAAFKVTVNASATVNFCAQAVVLTGAGLTQSTDVVGSGTTGNNATPGDPLTTTVANDLVMMVTSAKTTSTSQTIVAVGSWAILDSNMATSAVGGGDSDQAITTAQHYYPQATLSTTLQWASMSVGIRVTQAPDQAPTGLTATINAATSEHIAYTKPADQPSGTVSNYTVFNGAAGGACGSSTWSSWTGFTSSGGTSTSITVSGLSGATTYCFSVVEWNATGHSPFSSTTTGTTIPANPTAFSCGGPTVTSVACSWTNPSGTLANDTLYRWAGASCGGAGATGTSLGVVTSTTASGLTSATQYSFEAAAWSSSGQGAVSSCSTVVTKADKPTSLTISSVATTSFTVGWTNPAGTIANDTVGTTTTACTGTWTYVSLGTSGTSQSISGLTSATKYCVVVLAWSSSGTGGPAFTNGTTLPTAPTSLAAGTVTTTTIPLTWANPSGSLVNDTVYRWAGSSCSGTSTATSLGSAGTSNTQSGLASASTFSFEVAAWSAGGTSAVSACVTASTLPTAPTGLTVSSVTTTSISLTWSNPSGTLVNDTVYRWTGAACSGTSTATSLGSAGTSNTQSGLASATQFSFETAAWSAGGTSAVSSCVSGTDLPTAPTALTVGVVTTTTVPLTWANPSGSLVNDTVYRWTGAACSGTSTATSLAGVGTANTQSGLASAAQFSFEVAAWSSGGTSAVSSCVSGTTLPGAPTGLTLGTVGVTTLSWSWTNPSGTLANVTIYIWTGGSCGAKSSASSASLGVSTSSNLGGLAGATLYSVQVTAWSAGGESALSSCVPATTWAGLASGLAIAATTSTSISLSWSNPSGTIANDTAYRSTTACSTSVATNAGVVTSNSFGGLAGATTYCLGVQAWSSSGTGGTVWINGTTRPGAVTGLGFTVVGSSSLQVGWTNPSGTLVNISLSVGTVCGTWTQTFSLGVVASDWISGLAASTSYCVGVTAYSSSGAGSTSTATNSTMGAAPRAPTGLTVTSVGINSVTLGWKNPPGTLTKSAVFWGYRCDALAWSTTFGPSTAYAVSSLVSSTTYCFRVSAGNSTGFGNMSSAALGTTAGPSGGGGGGSGTPSNSSNGSHGGLPVPIAPVPTIGIVRGLGLVGLVGGIALALASSKSGWRWTGIGLLVAGLVLIII